jgi:20S proteasome alpha/beta subunit
MTYIAAFHCEGGIVLCTDTQETIGDQKRDVEKLYTSDNYPLAIGGAGIDEATDAFAQEVIERVEREQPQTIPELTNLLKAALLEVIDQDSQTSNWSDEYKKAQYIVAAWPNHDKAVIFRIRGRRVYRVKDHVIIGYETAPNYLLLKRMYKKSLPMVQAVMLAVYLVSQSKELDAYVGGETRIAIVDGDRAQIDYPEYIKNAEARIADFVKLIDTLFLLSVDPTISPSGFPAIVEAFAKDLTALRQSWLDQSAHIWFHRHLSHPEDSVEPYEKVFPGAMMTFMANGNVNISEEPPETKNQRLEMMREADRQIEERRVADANLKQLIAGRTSLYEGRERVLLRPARPPLKTQAP